MFFFSFTDRRFPMSFKAILKYFEGAEHVFQTGFNSGMKKKKKTFFKISINSL